jgi:RNA polymerase sigma-70 factor (ECF subfamily)
LPLRRSEGVPDELSDEAVIAACAVGEGVALGVLFDRYHGRVRRFLGRCAGTDDRDLDDLVQITFEAVPRAARSFDGRSAVRTWLLGIANNVVRHHVRGEIRRKRLRDAAATVPVGSWDSTTERVLEHERSALLRTAIAQLPPKLREAFVLVYLEGLSGAETADLVGAREGTIWKRLHQARAALRQALEGVER